ncbi:MAG TPA: polynucleotide adenylyltransferase PcnB [Candidatus Binataceae bacterium]
MEPRILERAEHPVSRANIDHNVLRVLYRLIGAGHIAYLVGGSVRDLMLGRHPKDFDVATSAHPQQVRDLFRNSRLIGRRFRLVHVFFGRQNVEVATFRRQTGQIEPGDDPLIRHDNTFGTPEEDAFRRDFTVNALFYDPETFRVIDYAGGVSDLEARLIRTIGEPELRVREDPVRMMRAVRFAAKLEFEIEPATRAAIERHRNDLLKSSVPRLVEETYKTLGQVEGATAILLMEQLGLLEPLLPWLSEHLKRHKDSLEQSPTVRGMAALGRASREGFGSGRSVVLATMFLDYWRAKSNGSASERIDLLSALRLRGFARADTEHMRLLIEAFEHLAKPSRRTRRLTRRPYFAEARRWFDLIAPVYEIDREPSARFLADPDKFFATYGAQAGEQRRSRRRRRRRRRGSQGAGIDHPASGNHAAPVHHHGHDSTAQNRAEPAVHTHPAPHPGRRD